MSESVNSMRAYTGALISGRSMTVTAPVSGNATVVVSRNGVALQTEVLTNGQIMTLGPWNLDVNFNVSVSAGSATVALQEAALQVSGNSFPTTDPTKTLVSTGAAATVGVGVADVVLDGVGTTFALTFPAPVNDGQVLRVMAGSAVSVAFSAVVTAPATAIKTVPSTVAAGVGLAWKYNESNTTWYRQY